MVETWESEIVESASTTRALEFGLHRAEVKFAARTVTSYGIALVAPLEMVVVWHIDSQLSSFRKLYEPADIIWTCIRKINHLIMGLTLHVFIRNVSWGVWEWSMPDIAMLAKRLTSSEDHGILPPTTINGSIHYISVNIQTCKWTVAWKYPLPREQPRIIVDHESERRRSFTVTSRVY